MATFLDGTGVTPGTEQCKCGPECELPCWQRLGWAPACSSCSCPSFPDEPEDPRIAAEEYERDHPVDDPGEADHQALREFGP